MVSDPTQHPGEPVGTEAPAEASPVLMMVCPSCQKPTALNFMWHSSATERMCLVCHHRKQAEKEKGVQCSGVQLTSGGAGRGAMLLKLGGMLTGGFALVVGLIWLLYKPHPLTPPPLPPMTEKEKVAARAGKARRNAARALIAASENAASGADTEKKDGMSGLKKRDPQSLMIASDGKPGKTERMAAKVDAIISELPVGPPD